MTRLVRSILDFLMRSGMTRDEVGAIFVESINQLNKNSGTYANSIQESHYVGNGDVSAEVMRTWHRDGRFLDGEARPRPLQLNRGSRSLGALVKKLDPSVNHMHSIRVMRAVGLIRRLPDGRYIPTAESVKIDHLHPLAVEHIAKSVVRLVTTVCRNTDPTHQSMSLIERYAYVPDLSTSEAIAFADFSRRQGMAYLEAVDDWLEQRRARRSLKRRAPQKTKGIAAGVHLFAYLGDAAETLMRKKTWVRKSESNKKKASSKPNRTPRLNSSRAIRA
jgi:hypothetical protein